MPKILCVEDEEDIRQILVDELSDEGYEVVEACNGRLGLEAIQREKPDLVVSDITMPVLDGHGLLKELREDFPEFADLPFIFLSALADRDHVVLGKKLGADDYITKPVDFDLLFATIESRLNQVSRMSARKEEQFVKLYRTLNEQTCKPLEQPESQPPQVDPLEPAASVGGPAPAPAAPAPPPAAAAPPPAASPAAPAPPPVRDRIQDLAAKSNGTLLAGHMKLVGLEEIKEALGDRWPSRLGQIRDHAEAVMRKRLSSEDVFDFTEDGNFLICFASLDERAAAFKANAIAREIREKVLGSDSVDLVIRENCEVASDVQRVEAGVEEIAASENVLDLIMARVTRATEEARRRERDTISKIVTTCQVKQIPVMTAKGAQVPLAISDFDRQTKHDIAVLRNARPGNADLASEIDILMLGMATEALCDSTLSDQSLLMVNVSFSTIETKRYQERYQTVCAALSDLAKNRLAFNLVGVPKESVATRLLPLVTMLRQYCRQVVLELSEPSLGNIDPKVLRTPFLTYRFESLSKQGNPAALKSVASELERLKVRILVYDVPSQEAARDLFGQGVSFAASAA